MKITNKQYAQSLYEVVSITEGNDVKIVVENFVKVLVKRNELGKIKKIVGEFEKVWNQEKGIVEGELVSAREISKDTVEILNNYIVQSLDVKQVELKQKIDKNILGGFVAKLGDIVIDSSLKTQLNNLKNKLTS